MPLRKSDLIPTIHLLGDLIFLNVSFLFGNYFLANHLIFGNINYEMLIIISLNFFWVIATYVLATYKLYRVMRVSAVLNLFLKTCVFHLFLFFAFMLIFKLGITAVKLFIVEYVIFILLIFSWRTIMVYYLRRYRARGYNFRTVVIAGAGQIGKNINKFFLANPVYGYKCLGIFDDSEKYENRIGSLKEMEIFALENKVDEIYYALPDVEHDKMYHLMTFADNNLIRFKIVPNLRNIGNQKMEIAFYDNILVLNFRKDPLESIVNRAMKRGFDLAFSLVVILAVFPWLFLIIALFIKLSSKGPVFFRQLRSGRGNKPFVCYKFRTMRVNALADQLQATKNDPRITTIGRFLRFTSMDELPQFFNVLIGNMSVVGPRPHMLLHTEKYSKEIDRFMVRHFVKSGITGLAQVNGCRGETTDQTMMSERINWDIKYIENWSFYTDLRIIFQTIIEILRGRIKGA